MWVLGSELGFSCLSSKNCYPLSHLSSPSTSIFSLLIYFACVWWWRSEHNRGSLLLPPCGFLGLDSVNQVWQQEPLVLNHLTSPSNNIFSNCYNSEMRHNFGEGTFSKQIRNYFLLEKFCKGIVHWSSCNWLVYGGEIAMVSFIEVHVILVYGGEMQSLCLWRADITHWLCTEWERRWRLQDCAGLLAVPGIGEREPQAGMHHTQLKSPRELVETDFTGARFWLKRQD